MFWQKLGLNGRVKWEDLSEGLQPNTFLYAKDTVEMKQGKGGRGNRGDQQVVRGGGGGRGRGVLEEAEEDLTVIFIFSCPRPPEATKKNCKMCHYRHNLDNYKENLSKI